MFDVGKSRLVKEGDTELLLVAYSAQQLHCSGYCQCFLMKDAVYNKVLLLTHILHSVGITSTSSVTGHQDFFSSICSNF